MNLPRTTSSERPARAAASPVVNRFALKIATVNGTGSASANGLLMQAIFRMGIPVSGKNLFPSNIQGLPTWYEIRVNADGHTARTPLFDLLVALNPATYARDVAEVIPGGWLLHDSTWPLQRSLVRADLNYLGVPLAGLVNARFEAPRERILMKNIACLGALAALLELDMAVVEGLLEETFARKKQLLDSNFEALRLGSDYAREHFGCPLPIRLERMDATRDHILIDGNTAAALGCVWAGATVAAWYPITPSTSLVEAFGRYCQKYRQDPDTGKGRYAILQAEDELAAAGMVVGAGWNGARAFTATSGPGISLMGEIIGLAYYAEIPAVFFDIQRTGPSTGMPTRTQQSDLASVVYASHGDTKHIALFPADPRECFDFAAASFDLAERFQTPVFVVSDLDIGMNDWVVPRLEWDDAQRPDRGKVLSADALEAGADFHRYLDVDGDGIPWRTLPGEHPRGAYFTRGSGHDRFGRYTEDAEAYTDVVDRLLKKLKTAEGSVPAPEVVLASDVADDAADGNGAGGGAGEAAIFAGAEPVGIVTLGGCRDAVLEAQWLLARAGVRADVLRVRAFPFDDAVRDFVRRFPRVFVVEQNRAAQLLSMLVMEADAPRERLISVRRYGGLPLSAVAVVEDVLRTLGAPADGEPLVAHRWSADDPAHEAVAPSAGRRGTEERMGTEADAIVEKEA
ncbi:MAG TPA: 2-oxoacid:acceptor oxidoreductase family protein [Longimicrobiales bacterium]|nr:2-oxoacid:acceptor oxidoreductase family protein [Longimicrobiales bacterium]